MFVTTKEAISQVTFDPIVHPQFDEDNNPIFLDGWKRIDWSKVKPIE